MSEPREGPFWDVMAGRAPMPAAAALLGFKLLEIDPAKVGTLIGEGRVVSKGSSIAFLSGELRDSAGELIATASATARIVRTR